MIFNPPFQAPDEDAHLYKIYGFTELSLNFKKFTSEKIGDLNLGEKITFGGQILPSGLVQASRYNKRITFKPKLKTSLKENKEISKISLEKNNKIFIGYPVPSYSILCYIPAFFAVLVLKTANATPYIMLMVGRLCSLFTYLVLCYSAIKITPIKKWLFLVLALLPMGVYEASALSVDALTNGLAFLFVAYNLYLAFEEKIKQINTKQIVFYLAMIALLSIIKFTYLPLIFLFFLIPKDKFSSEKKHQIIFASLFFITAIITSVVVLQYLTVSQGVQSYATILDKNALINSVFTHPLQYIILVVKSFLYNAVYYLSGFIGMFGWSDTELPKPILLLYSFLIILAGIVNYKEKTAEINLKNKLIFVAVTVLSTFFMFTVFYLLFMPDDYAKTIVGIQGRYFIPLAPLIFLLLHNKKIEFKTDMFKYLTLVGINFVLFISLIRIIYRFYV